MTDTTPECSKAPAQGRAQGATVAIVGAGPVGLSLALALARQGVRSTVLEREPGTSERSKAPGIHVRTLELFGQWGIDERCYQAGEHLSEVTLHDVDPRRRPLLSLDFSALAVEADRPGLLLLEQGHTERLLLDAVRETGMCDVRFGAEAHALEQGADAARLGVLEDGDQWTLDAEYVVGCDGASSFVREALGLPFDGLTYSLRPLLADVRLPRGDARNDLPWPRVEPRQGDYAFAVRLPGGLWRLVQLERADPAKGEDVPDEHVQEVADKVLGPGVVEVVWSSLFRVHVRSSPRFRVGRVLLAGDAAHVHSPASGFGMNGGIQDAHNLAWKLAHTLAGGDAERLLDSYDAERRAVIVEDVSRYTDRVTRTFLDAPAFVRTAAFFGTRQLLARQQFRRRLLRRTAMLDLDYPAADSPLLHADDRGAGLRLPNPRLRSPRGDDVRLYELLPVGPVLIDVAEERAFATDLPLVDVIRVGSGGYAEPAGLLRAIAGGDGVMLVRPDAEAAGTSADPIAFRGVSTIAGTWYGIYIRTNSPENVFAHVIVDAAGALNFSFHGLSANNRFSGNTTDVVDNR